MRAMTMCIALFAAPALAWASEAPRFSGEGGLVEGAVESSDGRFALKAELAQGEGTQRGGRFSLDARLAVSDLAKSTNAVCTDTGVIFMNSFE
jgi:hypothetical protein